MFEQPQDWYKFEHYEQDGDLIIKIKNFSLQSITFECFSKMELLIYALLHLCDNKTLKRVKKIVEEFSEVENVNG